jgi:hypothetical protein
LRAQRHKKTGPDWRPLTNLDVGESLDSDRSLEERPVLAALAGAVQLSSLTEYIAIILKQPSSLKSRMTYRPGVFTLGYLCQLTDSEQTGIRVCRRDTFRSTFR